MRGACQVLLRGLFCNKLFKKTNDPKYVDDFIYVVILPNF
jgi:hypothetical protein